MVLKTPSARRGHSRPRLTNVAAVACRMPDTAVRGRPLPGLRRVRELLVAAVTGRNEADSGGVPGPHCDVRMVSIGTPHALQTTRPPC